MSDGNSMNELKHFGSFDAVWGYVNHTKPISERYSKGGRSPNAGRIPLAERRYVNRYWCRKGVRERNRKTPIRYVEMFCDSNKPVLIWDERNQIRFTPDLWYDWRSAEFFTRLFGGKGVPPLFYTKHSKIYWCNAHNGKAYLLPRGQDYDIVKQEYGNSSYHYYVPLNPVQEYKHVMRKKRMAEIRAMFKPFYKYMQAVLAVDPEFGLSYEHVKYYDVEEFENLLRNPIDDPSIMKQMLVKCTTRASQHLLNTEWKTNALGGYYSYKDTRVGFKQAKEQFELILKVFYFNEVFEYVPIEIGKEVHDLNAKYGYSKWVSGNN